MQLGKLHSACIDSMITFMHPVLLNLQQPKGARMPEGGDADGRRFARQLVKLALITELRQLRLEHALRMSMQQW